jgi:acyl-CoA synthetase (AMP-forming)/AMP-acid ligase II
VSLLDTRGVRAAGPLFDTADVHHPALIDSVGCLSYGALANQVTARAAGLPSARTGRRLVHVPLAPHRDLVLGYLAVLAAGHVALVTPPEHRSITTVYPPDVWLHADGTFETATQTEGPRHLLHPDLALLLSTSGSTGSPKLVRLSHDNLLSNAEAIASALSINPADRAVTSLPLHYCFGLSVLHAQLRAGATTVLRPGSVTDPGFADELRRARVTMLAATPHVVELLDVQGALDQLPSLRLLAQAGGALPPERVRELANRGRSAGWGLAVMYGQTEATARMAVLPPELTERYPDAVGWPITGSSFRLDPAGVEQATDPAGGPTGELVFTGRGVMLGYAEHPDDLALGRMHGELRTGDLARIDADGLVRIVGRRSDFVKIAGIRTDLGQVERALRGRGLRCCVTGVDDQLQVTYQRCDRSPAVVREQAAEVSGVGRSVVSVRAVDELPVLPNGKLDRRHCAGLHSTMVAGRSAAGQSAANSDALAAVAAVLTPLVGRGGVDPDRSFVELGGDSFSHVAASIGLARVLGELPSDWHHRPVRDLAALAGRRPRSRGRRRLVQQVETTVVLRGVAVVTICGSHVGLFRLAGGAHILLAVAGFLFARYVLASPTTADRVRRTARIATGIVIPAVTVAAVMRFAFGTADWSNVAMVHWLARPLEINIFWFVEALLVIMAATVGVLAVPRLRAAYAADPWRTAMAAWPCAGPSLPRPRPVRRSAAWPAGHGGVAVRRRGSDGGGGHPAAPRDHSRGRGLTTSASSRATTSATWRSWPGSSCWRSCPSAGTAAAGPAPRRPGRGLIAHLLVQFQMFAFFGPPIVKFAAALGAGVVFCAVGNLVLRGLPSVEPALAAIRRPMATKQLVRKDMTCVDARS